MCAQGCAAPFSNGGRQAERRHSEPSKLLQKSDAKEAVPRFRGSGGGGAMFVSPRRGSTRASCLRQRSKTCARAPAHTYVPAAPALSPFSSQIERTTPICPPILLENSTATTQFRRSPAAADGALCSTAFNLESVYYIDADSSAFERLIVSKIFLIHLLETLSSSSS